MPSLFSYGTLQQPDVQRSTFGRLLDGHADELLGFVEDVFTIDDPAFVATSGKARHAIVRYTGNDADRVRGTVFEVSDGELALSDNYEPAGYLRVSALLASGKRAWVYAAHLDGEIIGELLRAEFERLGLDTLRFLGGGLAISSQAFDHMLRRLRTFPPPVSWRDIDPDIP